MRFVRVEGGGSIVIRRVTLVVTSGVVGVVRR